MLRATAGRRLPRRVIGIRRPGTDRRMRQRDKTKSVLAAKERKATAATAAKMRKEDAHSPEVFGGATPVRAVVAASNRPSRSALSRLLQRAKELREASLLSTELLPPAAYRRGALATGKHRRFTARYFTSSSRPLFAETPQAEDQADSEVPDYSDTAVSTMATYDHVVTGCGPTAYAWMKTILRAREFGVTYFDERTARLALLGFGETPWSNPMFPTLGQALRTITPSVLDTQDCSELAPTEDYSKSLRCAFERFSAIYDPDCLDERVESIGIGADGLLELVLDRGQQVLRAQNLIYTAGAGAPRKPNKSHFSPEAPLTTLEDMGKIFSYQALIDGEVNIPALVASKGKIGLYGYSLTNIWILKWLISQGVPEDRMIIFGNGRDAVPDNFKYLERNFHPTNGVDLSDVQTIEYLEETGDLVVTTDEQPYVIDTMIYGIGTDPEQGILKILSPGIINSLVPCVVQDGANRHYIVGYECRELGINVVGAAGLALYTYFGHDQGQLPYGINTLSATTPEASIARTKVDLRLATQASFMGKRLKDGLPVSRTRLRCIYDLATVKELETFVTRVLGYTSTPEEDIPATAHNLVEDIIAARSYVGSTHHLQAQQARVAAGYPQEVVINEQKIRRIFKRHGVNLDETAMSLITKGKLPAPIIDGKPFEIEVIEDDAAPSQVSGGRKANTIR